jgi:protein Hikeshi
MSKAFGIIPAGLPLITEPSSNPSPTSFLYALPSSSSGKSFSHVVVFLLPNVTLPPSTAAAIYVATAADVSSGNPNFKFLGGIGPGKESAMFKVGGGPSDLVIGVDVESEQEVGNKLQSLAASKGTLSTATDNNNNNNNNNNKQPPTVVLAQRIIQNAFNFLTSFSGTAGPGGVEVVPLKAFEEWWKKFESRVRADPSFLERQAD